MAMKITFEAQMRGAEEVSRYLSQWEQKLNSTGAAGEKMAKYINDGLKSMSTSLSQISQAQGGFTSLIKGFDDVGSAIQKNLGTAQKIILEGMSSGIQKLKGELKQLVSDVQTATNQLDLARKSGNAAEEADSKSKIVENSLKADALKQEIKRREYERFMHTKIPVLGITPAAAESMVAGIGKTAFVGAAALQGIENVAQLTANITDESAIRAQVIQRERVLQYAEAAKQGNIGRALLDATHKGYLQDYKNGKVTAETAYSSIKKYGGWGMGAIGSASLYGGLGIMGVGALEMGLGAAGEYVSLGALTPFAGPLMAAGGATFAKGAALTALGGGLRLAGADYKSLDEREQFQQSQLANLDEQKFGFVYNTGGKFEARLGQYLNDYQRAFGRQRANDSFRSLHDTTDMTIEEMGLAARPLMAQGKLPTAADAQYLLMQPGLGISGAWAASGAVNRPGTTGTRGFYESTKTLVGMAGLGGEEGFTARDPFSQVMADRSSQYFISSAEQQQSMMAPLAAAIGRISAAGGGQVNPIEAVKVGASMSKMFEDSMKNPMTIEGMQSDLWLSKMGIVNPLAQKAFKDMNLQNPDTMKALLATQRSNQTGKPVGIDQITDQEVAAATASYATQMKGAEAQRKSILGGPWMKNLDPGVQAMLFTKMTGGDNFTAGSALRTGISPFDMPDMMTAGNLAPGPRTVRESQRIDPRTGRRDTSDAAYSEFMANKQAVTQEDAEARTHDAAEKVAKEVGTSVINAIASGFSTIAKQLEDEAGKAGVTMTPQSRPANNASAAAANGPPPGSFPGLGETGAGGTFSLTPYGNKRGGF